MASSMSPLWSRIESSTLEDFKQFISQDEVLSGERIVEKINQWIQENKKLFESPTLNNDPHFIGFVSELTYTLPEIFSDKKQHRKYYHHLNHMQGRTWTYEDSSEKSKKTFSEYRKLELKGEKLEGKKKDELFEDREKLKNESSSKTEYWQVHQFLPLRIRAYIIEFLKTKKEDFVSPYSIIDKERYSSSLANQIASDIETLKYRKISQRIMKEENPSKLYPLLRDRVFNALTTKVFPNGYLISAGCKKHCLYVSLQIHKNQLRGMVFERGPFAKYHEHYPSETAELPCIYPYIFEMKSSKKNLSQVLQNLREAMTITIDKKEKWINSKGKEIEISVANSTEITKASEKIYQESICRVPLNQFSEYERYTYPIQTASNCVLSNHNFSLLRNFGFQELINDLILKEKKLAAIGSFYSAEPSCMQTPLDLQQKKAEELYQKALELEKGPSEGAPQWQEAFSKYQEAHELDLRKATSKLGFFYYYGLGTPPDVQKGIDLLEYSAEDGDPYGQAMYGLVCMLGIGGDPNIEAAQYWFKRAMDSGTPPGSLYARSLLFGINQTTRRFPELLDKEEEILKDLRNAADQGDVYANHLLVWGEKDKLEKKKRLEISNQWKFPDGMMTSFYYQCMESDDLKPLEDLLIKGYDFSAFLLGLIQVQNGNINAALEYFDQAAKAGIAQSYEYIADLYFKEDMNEEAAHFLRIGAQRGMKNAIFGLGLAYLKGYAGPDKNYGYELLRNAAQRGSDEAKKELAKRYENGFECVQDKEQAASYQALIENPLIPPNSYQLFQSLLYQDPKKSELSLSSSLIAEPHHEPSVSVANDYTADIPPDGSHRHQYREPPESFGPTGTPSHMSPPLIVDGYTANAPSYGSQRRRFSEPPEPFGATGDVSPIPPVPSVGGYTADAPPYGPRSNNQFDGPSPVTSAPKSKQYHFSTSTHTQPSKIKRPIKRK